MDDRIELIVVEYGSQRVFVVAIDLHERNVPTRDLPDTFYGLHFGVRQVVGDDNVVSGLDKLYGRVGSDIAGSSGHQYAFFHIVLVL